MKERPLVSNIILSQDALEYTRICVESIKAARTNTPFEIIIVDNNSSEETKDYLRTIDAVKYFSAVNLGVAGGRNVGFSLSSQSAEFVCFLDNDTVVSDYWIDEFVDTVHSDSRIGVVGASSNVRLLEIEGFETDIRNAWFKFCIENQNLSPKKQMEQFYREGFSNLARKERHNIARQKYELQAPPDYIPGWCQFIRKTAVIDLLTPMDPEYPAYSASDIDLVWNIAKAGYKVVYNERIFIHHFKGQSSIAKNLDELTKDTFVGYARLSQKWSNEIINYLASQTKKEAKLPYMSGRMVQSLIEFFGFFICVNGRWKLDEEKVAAALSRQT